MNILVNKRFKEFRECCGLTKEQLSDLLKIEESHIQQFENGERVLTIGIIEKACDLFGCSLEDLESISAINRIALNIRFMKSMLAE